MYGSIDSYAYNWDESNWNESNWNGENCNYHDENWYSGSEYDDGRTEKTCGKGYGTDWRAASSGVTSTYYGQLTTNNANNNEVQNLSEVQHFTIHETDSEPEDYVIHSNEAEKFDDNYI